MQLKLKMPTASVTAQTVSILQAKPLTTLITGNGFDSYCSTPGMERSVLCHRCRNIKPRRGAMSASIQQSSGKHVQHYLCTMCCDELRGGKDYD